MKKLHRLPTNYPVYLVLVAVAAVAIILPMSFRIRSLNHQIIEQAHEQANKSASYEKQADDTRKSLDTAKSDYDALKLAVLNDPAHSSDIGQQTFNFCDPSSKVPHTVSIQNIPDDQKAAQCVKIVGDTYIDSYVQDYGQ